MVFIKKIVNLWYDVIMIQYFFNIYKITFIQGKKKYYRNNI